MWGGLIATWGSPFGMFLAALIALATVVSVGARSREWFDDLSQAMKDAHGSHKAAAMALDYNQPRLSLHLNPKQPNFLTRVAEDEQIEREFVKRRAERLGYRLIDPDMAAVLEEAVQRKKAMAKATMESA